MLQLLRVESDGDALASLQRPNSHVLGGGSFLLRDINLGVTAIENLVRLEDPAARQIAFENGGVAIGARVTMAELAGDARLSWLRPAALAVGSPAVREMATVGGNLHAPSPYGDMATALLALDAEVVVASDTGRRVIPIGELLAGRAGPHARTPILAVRVSPPRGQLLFRKVTRVKPSGLAIMTIAADLVWREGRIGAARVALGAMGQAPLRAPGLEASLVGATLDGPDLGERLRAADHDVDPGDDAIASGWYRRQVLPVHLGRLLTEEGRPA